MLLLAAALAASATPGVTWDMPVINPAPQTSSCPETPMSLARKLGKSPPQAIPLSRLPSGRAFMAVDRRVDSCPAPLTLKEYRAGSRQ
jgi:hypothetical protein